MSIKYTSQLVGDKIVDEQIEVKDLNEKINIMPEELLVNVVGEGQIEVKDLNEKINIMPEELLVNVVGDEIVQQ